MSSTDAEAKSVHLRFNDKLVDGKSNSNFYHWSHIQSNLIDFDACYERLQLTMKSSNWIKPYHVVRPVCRIDPYEFNYLAIFTITAWPIFVIIVAGILVYIWHHEYSLCIATTMNNDGNDNNSDQDRRQQLTFVRRIMHFWMSPNFLIRVIDLSCMILSQVPHHIDAAAVYLDLISMISRTRKVYEALRGDLNTVLDSAHEHNMRASALQQDVKLPRARVSSLASINRSTKTRDSSPVCGFTGDMMYYRSGPVMQTFAPRFSIVRMRNRSLPTVAGYDDNHYGNMDGDKMKVLNNKLELHIKFASLINNEFTSIKRSHTSLLNIYIAGSGILLATTMSALYSTRTDLGRGLVLASMASGSVPLVVCLFCCVLIERAVSSHC